MSPSLVITRESQDRNRLSQTPKDDVPSTLCADDIEFISRLHLREYTTWMLNQAARINQEILGSSQGHFQIMIPFCIYTMRYSFHLKGFIREVFRYYQMGPSQLHLNRWIILFTFDKCYRLIGNSLQSMSLEIVTIQLLALMVAMKCIVFSLLLIGPREPWREF